MRTPSVEEHGVSSDLETNVRNASYGGLEPLSYFRVS